MYRAQLTQAPQLTQKTSITPRLQQALKVLNMPLQELTQFISQELEQNPFLELEEDDEIALPTEESDPCPGADRARRERGWAAGCPGSRAPRR